MRVPRALTERQAQAPERTEGSVGGAHSARVTPSRALQPELGQAAAMFV